VDAQLIGRGVELARLVGWWNDVVDGKGGVALVRGDAGIGKTTLLEALSREAEDPGHRVHSAKADELEVARPFGVLRRALGGQEPATDAPPGRLGDLPQSPASDGDGPGFFELVDRFADLIEREAIAGPTLLLVDDAQWADSGTLAVLGAAARLARSSSLGIVVGVRPTVRPETAAFLDRLPEPPLHVELGPLTPDETVQLAAERLGATPDPALADELHRAGGNPFYVLGLVDALQREERIRTDEGGAQLLGGGVPSDLALTVLHRVGRLSEDARETLRLASVLGGSFRAEDLVISGTQEPAALHNSLVALREEGLIVDAGERLRFHHDIVREVVYGDLGEPLRLAAHRRVAGALAEGGRPAAEVTPHLLRAASGIDPAAARWLVDAARDPTMGAPDVISLLENALARDPALYGDGRVVEWLARLKLWQGRPGEAIGLVERALEHPFEQSERLALMELAFAGCFVSRGASDAARWLGRAEELDGDDPGGSPDAVTRLRRARMDHFRGDLRAAAALTESLLPETGALDPYVAVEVFNQATWLAVLEARSTDALRFSDRLITGPLLARSKPWFLRHRAWALADVDDIPAAHHALFAGRESAEAQGQLKMLADCMEESALLRFHSGELDEAAADAEAAISTASEAGTSPPSIAVAVVRWIGVHRGTEPLTEPASEWESAAAVAGHLAAGRLEDAGALSLRLYESLAAAPLRERRWYDYLPVIAAAAAATAQPELAAGACRLASSGPGDAPGLVLAQARCGLFADGHVASARRVVELALSSPRRLLAAEALEDAAGFLPPPEATAALEEVARRYADADAVRSLQRVDERLGALGARPAPRAESRPVSGWGSLTTAERRVVELAAEGLTNREIGGELFVSHRTVANHLAHVFDKLGIRSRVELAREAARRASQ